MSDAAEMLDSALGFARQIREVDAVIKDSEAKPLLADLLTQLAGLKLAVTELVAENHALKKTHE